uniref:Uncharacterized protein n=1 Tax=Cacopsylla melanoneura TaxID=428564 RepID=A0A8D8VTH0_9HEMI
MESSSRRIEELLAVNKHKKQHHTGDTECTYMYIIIESISSAIIAKHFGDIPKILSLSYTCCRYLTLLYPATPTSTFLKAQSVNRKIKLVLQFFWANLKPTFFSYPFTFAGSLFQLSLLGNTYVLLNEFLNETYLKGCSFSVSNRVVH